MTLQLDQPEQPVQVVTAAVIRRGGTLLLARRQPGQKLAGYWEFPGGKVETGESVQTCLQREIAEELGIAVKAGAIIATSDYVYAHGAIRLVALDVAICTGEPIPTVHDRLEWVPVAQLLDYRLAPADIPLAEALVGMSSRDDSART